MITFFFSISCFRTQLSHLYTSEQNSSGQNSSEHLDEYDFYKNLYGDITLVLGTISHILDQNFVPVHKEQP